MKLRTGVFALLISLTLLISGCMPAGRGVREEFELWRSELGLISMKASIRADYGQTVADFVLVCTEAPDSFHIDVVEPALIAGAGATLYQEESRLEYEGIMLSAEPLAADGTSPLTVLPTLIRALRDWPLADLRIEETENSRQLRAELTDMEQTGAIFWFEEDMTLSRAELVCSGCTAAFCTVTEWSSGE